MPNGKLSELPKLTAQQKKAFLALEATGIEITQAMKDQILSLGGGNNGAETGPKSPLDPDRAVRESELVLRSLEVPSALRLVKCKECGLPFGTNYTAIAYCSQECRAEATRHRFGIEYDFSVPERERYYPARPPAIIRPENMAALRAWARHILELAPPDSPGCFETPQVQDEIPKGRLEPEVIEAPPAASPSQPPLSLLTGFQIL